MREALAERLLATVMGWTPEDVAAERPGLQVMAEYKYDEYQQFSPGMRFVESLALWLGQFNSPTERQAAYDFIKTRLIFCSTAEMSHLVSTAYPDHIRPFILRKAALDAGLKTHLVAATAQSSAFRARRRQCLFLGLSDGARTDLFRRYNNELSHEQVLQTYEVSDDRVESLLKKLSGDPNLKDVPPDRRRFRTVVLLDDFSASGKSYLRADEKGGYEGKIASFYMSITDSNSAMSRLVGSESPEIVLVLYTATEQARKHLEHMAQQLWGGTNIDWTIKVVHQLGDEIALKRDVTGPLSAVIDHYYDHRVHDEHLQKGGTADSKYGFANCGLPLVLAHNTPNNSIALLWSYESMDVRGLFPRVQRHKTTQ